MTATSQNTLTAPTSAQWDAANKFLGQLFVNSTLAQGYLNICQQANGQTNAPQMLNNWLSSQGYDTTPELVYAALIALQNISLAYWSGVYGQSFFQDTQGHTSVAPVLAIIPDAEGNAIPYLDGVALQNFTFKSVITNNIPNPTLTWGLDNNSTAGNIIFYYTSPITPESSPPPTGYTGNWFQGTLQTSATTSPETYYAGLGQSNSSEPTPLQTQENGTYNPINASFWSGDNWPLITIYALSLLGIVDLIVMGALTYREKVKFGRWPWEAERERLLSEIDGSDRSDLMTDYDDTLLTIDYEMERSDINMEDVLRHKSIAEVLEKLLPKEGGPSPYSSIIAAEENDQPLPPKDLKPISNKDDLDLSSLSKDISQQTGISEAEVSSSLKNIQNNPQQKADWDQLMKEGVDKGYFKNPDQDNDDYQSWLQQVKDTLKEASVPDQPSSVQPQQPESPKAPEPSSEPPAPQTQPVPPQENPLAQQEKTGVGQPQVAPVPSEQQPVQGSQTQQIQNASNSLGTETSTPPVQTTSPDVQQTPPDKTKNESEFDPLAESE